MGADEIALKEKIKAQREAFEKFINAIESSEPLNEEFDEIMNIGINIGNADTSLFTFEEEAQPLNKCLKQWTS